MKALVVYDSGYGNTEQIAKAIAGGIGKDGVRVLRASEAKADDLAGLNMLVVGSPTQGGRPTQAVQDFLKTIPSYSLQKVKAAAFDTRIVKGGVGAFAKIFGYAASRIESALKDAGAVNVVSEGFAVKGRQGPLQDGEIERATKWGAMLASQPVR